MGDPAPRGKGRAGDLLVHVNLLKGSDFRLEGCDLHSQVDVAPWELVLGAVVPIKTLEGRAQSCASPRARTQVSGCVCASSACRRTSASAATATSPSTCRFRLGRRGAGVGEARRGFHV
jgi:hypothetical protein